MYIVNVLDLLITMLQSKVSLYNSKKQAEINELLLDNQGELSYNIGFQYNPDSEFEEYYDD